MSKAEKLTNEELAKEMVLFIIDERCNHDEQDSIIAQVTAFLDEHRPAPVAVDVEGLAKHTAKRILGHCELKKWRLSATLIDHPQARKETLSDIACMIADAIRKGRQDKDKQVVDSLFDLIYAAEVEMEPDVDKRLRAEGLDPKELTAKGLEFVSNLKKQINTDPAPVQGVEDVVEVAEDALLKAAVEYKEGGVHCTMLIEKQIESILRTAIDQATRPLREFVELHTKHAEYCPQQHNVTFKCSLCRFDPIAVDLLKPLTASQQGAESE